jgi:hypothetical protein
MNGGFIETVLSGNKVEYWISRTVDIMAVFSAATSTPRLFS